MKEFTQMTSQVDLDFGKATVASYLVGSLKKFLYNAVVFNSSCLIHQCPIFIQPHLSRLIFHSIVSCNKSFEMVLCLKMVILLQSFSSTFALIHKTYTPGTLSCEFDIMVLISLVCI